MKSLFKVTLNGEVVDLNLGKHTDGASYMKLQADYPKGSRFKLTLLPRCADSLINFLHFVNYCRQFEYVFDLDLVYLMFGRQDRVEVNEDKVATVLTLKSLTDIINMSSDVILSVTCHDPHSSVFSDLISLPLCISSLRPSDIPFVEGTYVVVSPDKGAINRTILVAEVLNLPMIVASKIRDPETKDITLSLDTDVNLQGKKVLLIDDIADYGTTLRETAKILKEQYGASEVNAYITHGILPVNERLETPSRFSFLLDYIDNLHFKFLWDVGSDESNEHVTYNDLV